ncbi:hypothetical protein D7M10_12005 [Pseudomonas fluorescens]|nr:hypothetical protein D7M10_12005 [Pseudomonas fluorescens]
MNQGRPSMTMEERELAFYIILPPFILTIVAALILYSLRRDKKWWHILYFDPDHGLSKQTLFWVALLTPVLYFLAFGCLIWNNYDISLTAGGLKTFFEISKLPLTLLSLSIPLTALATKLHSTKQAARQIEKNKHELFYLHRREFVSYYDMVGKTKFSGGLETEYKINPRIHDRLFEGKPSGGTPNVKTTEINNQMSLLISARGLLRAAISEPKSSSSCDSYATFCKRILDLISFFSIQGIEKKLYAADKKIVHGLGFTKIITTTIKAIDGYRCVENYMITTLVFADLRDDLKKIEDGKVNFEEILSKNPNKNPIENIVSEFQYYPTNDNHARPYPQFRK